MSCCRSLDEGGGIPPDELESIFDKFYRVQKGDQVRAGTGLGLAISRGFVEAMQRHDRGRQPHRPQRRGLHHPAARSGTTPGIGYRRMSAAPIKVLVIDDEPPIRKLLRMGLTHARLRDPGGAERQDRAREARAKNPTLIILDLGLPDIQGHELLRTIRGAQRSRADRGAVEPRRRGRQGAGARSRRRRLRDQAVRHGRAAGAHARGAAASAAGPGRAAGVPTGDLSVDLVRRIVKVGEQRGKAVAEGVRSAARAGAARRQGADPQVPARRSSGTS